MLPIRSDRYKSKRFRRLAFEPLEARQMLATITVTSLADSISVDGEVTLREAIHAAELDVSVDGSAVGSGADTIQFAANLSGAVNLLLVGDVAIDLSAFAITTDITIRGNAAGTTIQRSGIGPEMRLFRVSAIGNLTLESIMISGGLLRGVLGMDPNAGGDARGGAIFNQGTLEVIASTLVGNQARGGDGMGSSAGGSAKGGAIHNDGGMVSIVNTTLSGNVAQSGSGASTPPSFAAGIYSLNGTLKINNSTITNNTAAAGRGVFAVAAAGSATVEIFSSIIGQAEASPTNFDLIASTDAGGSINVTGANNLIRRQNDFAPITISSDDPLLGPLVNNGGSTPTHALADSSPAMNHGSNRLSLSTDQRGTAHLRVMGGQADIGAFEVQTSIGPSLPGDYNVNHVVDAADYVIWRKTLGSEVNLFAGADGDGNGRIDAQDYNLWRSRFAAFDAAAEQLATPSSSLVQDSSAAAAGGTSFDPFLLQGAAATKNRNSRIGLTSATMPSGNGNSDDELLDLIASNVFAEPMAEGHVWESAQFQATEEAVEIEDGAARDGAMNAAFESIDSNWQGRFLARLRFAEGI